MESSLSADLIAGPIVAVLVFIGIALVVRHAAQRDPLVEKNPFLIAAIFFGIPLFATLLVIGTSFFWLPFVLFLPSNAQGVIVACANATGVILVAILARRVLRLPYVHSAAIGVVLLVGFFAAITLDDVIHDLLSPRIDFGCETMPSQELYEECVMLEKL